MSILTASGIRKSFRGNTVLHGVSLTIDAGEIIGLLGENGAGKSTFMNVLSGTLSPDAGVIQIDGSNVQFASASDGLAAGIRFIRQELSLMPSLSVAENILLGSLPKRRGFVDYTALRRRAAEILAEIGASHIDVDAEVGGLRLGEQQLVEIARAVSQRPRILIMDEPTSSLTAHEVEQFFGFVRRIAAAGTAVIFITHRLSEALSLCDRLVVLRNGTLVAERHPDEATRESLIVDMTGRASLFNYERRDDVRSQEAALEVIGASDGEGLSDISFQVQKGEVFGLFGLVGAGRTELLEMICGLRRCARGQIRVSGADAQKDRRGHLRAGVSIVPEGRKIQGIFPQHSVRWNLSAGTLRRTAKAGFISPSSEVEAMTKYRTELGIRMQDPEQLVGTLSGGNQQKVLIGRALVNDPQILLLDEPTHGVDVGAKADIYRIVRAEAAHGRTIVVASSEIDEIRAVCDRVGILSKGRLVAVLNHDGMEETAMLTHAFSHH